ncbi:MAG: DUF805 domain-containing protein [Rubrivivax sp.]|nr:DUF805 domain-containing protein [Rubrivivax sp.]
MDTLTPSRWLADEPMSPLRIFLDPRGRIARREFWLYGVLALFGLTLLLQTLLAVARVPSGTASTWVQMLLLWPAVAVSIKRWHDRDKSGWWVLIVLLPLVGWLWALIDNGFLAGTRGANRFGDDPVQPLNSGL